MRSSISIIIPVLNEAAIIGRLLEQLHTHSRPKNIQEIIVVDGGSSDETREVVERFPPVQLLKGSAGRARQMNAGAQVATGQILYFLHADTFPPPAFDEQIIAAVASGQAGCFRLKFDPAQHWMLKVAPWFTQFRSFFFRGGDQSLFLRKEAFDQLQGFDERYVIYEDVEFIQRIRQHLPFVILPDFVRTSGRRFEENGTFRLYVHFLIIHLKSWLGASPGALYDYYQRHIRG